MNKENSNEKDFAKAVVDFVYCFYVKALQEALRLSIKERDVLKKQLEAEQDKVFELEMQLYLKEHGVSADE